MKNDNENNNENNENENINDNLSSIDIEGIRTVCFFCMKDILNVKNTNKSTSSNFYPCNIHKQKHFK